MAGVRLDGGTGGPRLEGLFGLPLRHHEVPVFTLDRAEQLKAQETWRALDCVCAVGEPLLQLGAGVCGHLDCVDLHHWHCPRLPRGPQPTMRTEATAPTTADLGRAKMGGWPLIC